MKKKILIAVAVALLIIAGVVGFKLTQKSTQEILQSKSWSWVDEAGDGLTVQFQEKNIQMGELGSLPYSINEKKHTITLLDKSVLGEKQTKIYSYEKNKDGYTLKPTNNDAKEWGTITLATKKGE